MDKGTRNILIGVGLALVLSTFLCCGGGLAYVLVVRSLASDGTTTKAPSRAPEASAGAGERWPTRDFKTDYKAARKAGWKVNRPKSKKVTPPGESNSYFVQMSWDAKDKPSRLFRNSAERSSFVTALVLAGAKPELFSRKSGFSGFTTLNRAVYLGGFGNCGPLVDYEPYQWGLNYSPGEAGAWTGRWLTRLGCAIEVDVKQSTFKEQNYYLPTKVVMYRPDSVPDWIVRRDQKTFRVSEATRLARKHGDEMPYKIRKARVAGMKAEHYYPSKTVGNHRLIREIIPKAKVVGDVDLGKVMLADGTKVLTLGYNLEFEGQRLKYRVYFNSLSQFTRKASDTTKLVVAGEHLEIDD